VQTLFALRALGGDVKLLYDILNEIAVGDLDEMIDFQSLKSRDL